MEQHPLPRQITSFEFKLVGFMTLHQFIYLLVFVPMGFAVYSIIPIPFVNIFLGFIIGSIGMLLAFLPVNDRPLDVFLKNLFKRLTSPTQYLYQKSNQQVSFPSKAPTNESLQEIKSPPRRKIVFDDPTPELFSTKLPQELLSGVLKTTVKESSASNLAGDQILGRTKARNSKKQPFFIGTVKNNKDKPLPEILVYVKDETNMPVRLLKTNPHGIFATYSSLPQGEYLMEAKDPRGSYLFEAMKVHLSESNPTPFTMLSKSIL